MPTKGLLCSLPLAPPSGGRLRGTKGESVKTRVIRVWSKAEQGKARALMKLKRSTSLPRLEDLPKLERAAEEEMRGSNGELGVG